MAQLKTYSNIFLLFVLTFLTVGCSSSIQTGEVEGILLIAGKPAHKIYIQFHPDSSMGTKGPPSYANTDAQGRFKLEMRNKDGSSTPGAVVGKHFIVLNDIQMSESATGQGVPVRLKPEWQTITSTPLKQEVKPGKQTIELKF
jgi:hypothetical protein